MELRWIASSSTSALHAADRLMADMPLIDNRITETLGEPVRLLREALRPLGPGGISLWDSILAFSASIEGNQQLVDTAARKALGSGAGPFSALVGAITRIETSYRALYPGLADELALRSKPLVERWESRGPGLLTMLAQSTDSELLAPRADIVLMQPAVGGAGTAHLFHNLVRIEGVLADPLPDLPEVVRLAWLLSQLQLELARFSEHVSPARLPRIASLAMLIPTIEAAQGVEWAIADERSVGLALREWRLTDSPDEMADLLWRWWSTFRAERPSFALALRALERMLIELIQPM